MQEFVCRCLAICTFLWIE